MVVSLLPCLHLPLMSGPSGLARASRISSKRVVGHVEAGNGCSPSVCLHPHVCSIVPAVRVETEVWQRAYWVIRFPPCALKVTAPPQTRCLFTYSSLRSQQQQLSDQTSDLQPDGLQLPPLTVTVDAWLEDGAAGEVGSLCYRAERLDERLHQQ